MITARTFMKSVLFPSWDNRLAIPTLDIVGLATTTVPPFVVVDDFGY